MSKRRKINGGGPELFIEPSGQLRLLDKSVEQLAQETWKFTEQTAVRLQTNH
jgi:hypothetical protein